jgi:pimeloyl-ACP methyl ester carboxylesterase
MLQPSLPDLAGVEHRYVDVGGLRIHVAEAGSGDPVVLLHGWPQHWWMWRGLIPRLAEAGHRVLAPDLRGLGWTDVPDDDYAKATMAADLIGLLDALELDVVALAGHDWGAYSGFLAVDRAPARFRAFMAMSVPHPWPSRAERLDPRALLGIAHMPFLAAGSRGVATVAERVLRHGRADGGFTEAEARTYLDVLRVPERARASSAIYRTFLVRELPSLVAGRAVTGGPPDLPIAVLTGDRDPVTRTLPEQTRGRLTVERVPGASHFLPEERPDLVAERALAFLA